MVSGTSPLSIMSNGWAKPTSITSSSCWETWSPRGVKESMQAEGVLQRGSPYWLCCACRPVTPALGGRGRRGLQFQGQCGLYSETLSQNKTNLGHPFMELNLDISLQLCTYLLFFLTPISHTHTHAHTQFFWFYSDCLSNF